MTIQITKKKTEFASNLKTKVVNVCSGKNVKVSLLNQYVEWYEPEN